MAAAYLAGGMILTTLLIYGVAVLSCFCFILLFRVRDDLLQRKSLPIEQLHFETVMMHVLGTWGKVVTTAAIIFTQAGFATAYVIFVSDNLNKLYDVLSFREYALLLIVPLILLCWIRSLKYLNPFALAGLVAIGLAVGTVVYYCVLTIRTDGINGDVWLRTNWSTFPVAYGVVIYLFEGIGLILPLEQKMRDPSKFRGVMWSVHLSIATVVAAFGLLGYISFYLCTKGPIIKNLPGAGPLVTVTVWGLNVSLLFTYPIQMVPVFQIIEDSLLEPSRMNEQAFCCGRRATFLEAQPRMCRTIKPSTKHVLKSMLLRAIVVVLSVGAAISIPYFDLFLSLIGGLGSACLMFVLPPAAYLKAFWKETSVVLRVACIVLFVFGIATMGVTTVFTILGIVQQAQGGGVSTLNCTQVLP